MPFKARSLLLLGVNSRLHFELLNLAVCKYCVINHYFRQSMKFMKKKQKSKQTKK